MTKAPESAGTTSASTGDITTPTQSTQKADSSLAAKTGASSTTRANTQGESTTVTSAAAISPTTSAQVVGNTAGAPARYTGYSIVMLVVVMGLRAVI